MRKTYANKGMAPTALLAIVLTIIIVLAILIILESQTGFLSKAALYLANLLTFKVA